MPEILSPNFPDQFANTKKLLTSARNAKKLLNAANTIGVQGVDGFYYLEDEQTTLALMELREAYALVESAKNRLNDRLGQ